MIKYELVKLGKKKLFLLLAFLLAAVNLLTLYTYEKNTGRFFYACRQRENYEAYLNGDETADIDDFYKQDKEAQEAYIKSYPVFIDGMEERADRLKSTSLYKGQDSYAHRNLVKTCGDFASFSSAALKADNCFRIRAMAGYTGSIVFALVYLAVLAYYVLFFERDMDLLLLLKGSRKGHTPLAAAKLSAMVIAAFFYTVLTEGSTLLLLGRMYGYGDLQRAIQSVSLFRNCIYTLTVGETLFLAVLIRAVAAVFFACALFCIGMLFKNEFTAAGLAGGLLGVAYFFSRVFSINGSLSGVKCVNPFYCWDIQQVLGEYHNLNILGYPVGKNMGTGVTAVLSVFLCCSMGIWAFNKTCQIRAEGRLEVFWQWLRSRTGFLERHLSLLYYEFYKMLVQQKKGIVLALLLIWGIYEINNVFGQQYYATALEASYHYYAGQLQGPVTEETFSFMEKEGERLSRIREEIGELGNSGEDDMKRTILMADLERYEDAFEKVQDQLGQLKEKPGNISGKYLVDEMAYEDLWGNTGTDIALWFVGAAVVFYFISGIYTLDEKKKMHPLLRSMWNGRGRLNRSRNICAIICTGIVFIIMELPLFLRYVRIDHFSVAAQKLCDFTDVAFSGNLPLGFMVACVFLLKAISFFVVCLAGLKFSKTVKNELPAMLAGIGCAGIVAMVSYHFGWDINMLLIKLL